MIPFGTCLRGMREGYGLMGYGLIGFDDGIWVLWMYTMEMFAQDATK